MTDRNEDSGPARKSEYAQTRTVNGVTTTYIYTRLAEDFPKSELLAIFASALRRACRDREHGPAKHGRDLARQMDRLAIKTGQWTNA